MILRKSIRCIEDQSKNSTSMDHSTRLLLARSDLCLGGTSDLLHSVLLLLLLLSGDLCCGVLHDTLSNLSELGLELLGKVHGVIDHSESGAPSASEVGLESIGGDSVRSALVHSSQLLTDHSLWNGTLARM